MPVNEAWGTHIWSQYYQSFEQVPAPVKTPFLHNASLSTAYRMFCRESVADFMVAQSEVIKAFSDKPITHNDNPAFNIHHERSMQAQDFASYDIYATTQAWGAFVFRSDLYRAAIPGRPFWVMETSTAHNGWLGNHHPVHPKGYLVAEAALVYGLGGEGFSYWLWRLETPEIAVTYSDHARAMIETEGLDKREGFPKRYRGVIEHWHSIVRDLGYHREVRFEGASLAGLKLLLTPAMPYVSEAFASKALDFIKNGGIWIAGPVTGTREREHTVPTETGLGIVDAMAGVSTEFVVPLTSTDTYGEAFGLEVPLSGWCAAVTPVEGTKSIGTISRGVAAKHSFITERKLGKGKLVLLGAHPHGEKGLALIQKLISHYANEAKVAMQYSVSSGTIVCPRVDNAGNKLWMVVNMDGKGGELELPQNAKDTLTAKSLSGKLTLTPYQWRLINV